MVPIRLVVPTENGTFQDNASKLFNKLPETIKGYNENLFKTFTVISILLILLLLLTVYCIISKLLNLIYF